MIIQIISQIIPTILSGSRLFVGTRNRLHRLFSLTIIALMVLGVLLTITFTYAQDDMSKKTANIMKGISGEVSGIAKDFIAVVYRRDEAKGAEEEIALPVAKDVVVEHKKSLTDIGVGDLVDVEFAEYTEETTEGPRTKRVAKVIRFIRAAAPKQTESSVLGSGLEGSDEPEGQ